MYLARYSSLTFMRGGFSICMLMLALCASADNGEITAPAEKYCEWHVTNYAIAEPLCGLTGNVKRGYDIVSDSGKGNCIACHVLPLENVSVYGTIAPSLVGVGTRYNEGQLRIRTVDTRNINPMSIMPGFYRDPALINRPAKKYIGRTFLTAQQVEDVVAYLKTLK